VPAKVTRTSIAGFADAGGRVQAWGPDQWNPASAWLNWGARLSLIGLLRTALIVAVAFVTYGW
jgi:hypothetical protein